MNIDELSGWGISKQIAEIVENGFSFDDETGEIFFTTDDLDSLQEALEGKIESLAGIYQMYNSKANALTDRAKEISERAKSFEKKADRIKDYIDDLMKMNQKDSLEVGDKKISYRKSVSSSITDEEALRKYIEADENRKEEFYSYKEPDISKKALSDAIKATKQENGDYTLRIPGFELVENKNLSIK